MCAAASSIRAQKPKMHDRESASGETEIIQRYFAPLAGDELGALGLIDDAALLAPASGDELVLTTDIVVAGVHVLDDARPQDVAHKALGVNVSDLVSKGAEPLVYLLSLALPGPEDCRWLQAFSDGLKAAQEAFGCHLVGGDTVRTPGPLTISITAIGRTPSGRMVRRSGARPSEIVYVSGSIGDAALGLRLLAGEDDAGSFGLERGHVGHLFDRYWRPAPPVGLVSAVRDHASAAMDVSDGLAGDFRKLCAASGVGGAIRLADVPLSAAAGRALDRAPDLIERLVTGGDDYEVLAVVPEARGPAFESDAGAAGVRVTRIGRILTAGDGVRFIAADGGVVTFARDSFDHF